MSLALTDKQWHGCSCLQLNLGENDLGAEGAEILAPALVQGSLTLVRSPAYRTLPLCFLSLSTQTLFRSCLQLDLSANNIGGHEEPDGYGSDGDMVTTFVADPSGVQAIADALRVSPSMTAIGKSGLNLKGNGLGDDGWGAIFAGVCSNKDSKISSVDVSDERIGPPGAKLIADALQKSVNPSLTVADLRFNELDTDSATMLTAVAKEKGISLCGIKPEQTEANLQGDDYEGYMKPADAILLTADLAVCGSLMTLDARGNELGKEGEALLQGAVEGRTGFKLVL